MRSKTKFLIFIWIILFSVIGLPGQSSLSGTDKKVIADFEKQARKYVSLREKVAAGLPKLSDRATPEEIASHKAALQERVRASRTGARPGDIFSPAAVILIRSMIKEEFKGYERAELRQTVLEADTKGVPIKINVPYPESKELVEMSPALLLRLPQLPKQLRYRYIGRSLAILDRDCSLIVDFMRDALP